MISRTTQAQSPQIMVGGLRGSDSFSQASAVRLQGLKNHPQYNHHVGRVVSPEPDALGRLQVDLHGVIWQPDSPKAIKARFQSQDRCRLLVPAANVKRVAKPDKARALTVLGTVPALAIVRLMGFNGWGLPDCLAELVAEKLSIQPVDPAQVSVTGCSSTRGDFPLKSVLDKDSTTWWISKNPEGRAKAGTRAEWLEFSFGRLPRRVSYVGIKIPPLPAGPLSTRQFHLLAKRHTGKRKHRPELELSAGDRSHLAKKARPKVKPEGKEEMPECGGNDEWLPVPCGHMQTLDRGVLQELAIVPPVETTAIRLVSTSNAAEHAADLYANPEMLPVGLFQVAFA